LSVTDVISTDKTGTLTQNTMTIKEIVLSENKVSVSGDGWIPEGLFFIDHKKINPSKISNLNKLIQASVVCSNAKLVVLDDQKKQYEIKGDPTEGAMTVLGAKANFRRNSKSLNIIDETPFNQDLKYKQVAVLLENKKEIFISGAPENVIDLCASKLTSDGKKEMTDADRKYIYDQISNLSQKAMRIIGLAYKDYGDGKTKNMIFLGLVAMSDPPRIGVKEAIAKAKLAGIRIIMKTGDFKGTAIAIAKEVGIIDPKNQNPNYPEALTGEELFSLPQEKFEEMIENVSVFARLTPKMKLDILETLQKRGHCVAMTGDGVNDALALKKADIGISMGLRGTDVARESSDIVLADDNFASIINAIEEGRVVYQNTMQTSSFLVTTNFAEHAIIIISMLFGLPLPLTASQILWLNLVTDGVANIPLAIEPSHGDLLLHPPRKKDENILSKSMVPFMITIVLSMIVLTFLVYLFLLPQGLDKARTGAFTIMAMCQIFNIFNMRSLDKSLFKIGLFSNKGTIYAFIISLTLQTIVIYHPFLQKIFNFDYISYQDFFIIVILSSFILWIGEIYKMFVSRNTSKVALPSLVV
jgi:P-type Ca2+ transporter type 2C